uniref:Anthranilate phosphoribosyltransferase n=1 Tax=Lygus hesperus TaxID=30085 RepID=A0A0A9ZAH0_LYGHE
MECTTARGKMRVEGCHSNSSTEVLDDISSKGTGTRQKKQCYPVKHRLLDHKVCDGGVTIVRVVNPTLYWIRCSKCVSTAKMQRILQHSTLSNASDIQRGQRIISKSFNGLMYRAVVQHTERVELDSSPRLYYKVLLIDLMDTLIVDSSQLFQGAPEKIMDGVPQLHLVGIQDAIPVGHLEIGITMDEEQFLDSQRKTILRQLGTVDSLTFQTTLNWEHVTWGKIRMISNTNSNFLRFLVEAHLARYVINFSDQRIMEDCIDSVMMEHKAVQELMCPPRIGVNSRPVVRIPSPPLPVYDQEQINLFEKFLKKSGNSSVLTSTGIDKMVLVPRVETFEEMNRRYRRAHIMVPGDSKCSTRSKVLGISSNSTSVADGVSMWSCYCDPSNPASSDEDYGPSSESRSASSSMISSEESDLTKESKQAVDLPANSNCLVVSPPYASENNRHRRVSIKCNYVSEQQQEPKESMYLTFGRGHIFRKIIMDQSRRQTSNFERAVAGQFDDADQSARRSCCTTFIPDMDYIQGFLDESNDSDEIGYNDVIRRIENQHLDPPSS